MCNRLVSVIFVMAALAAVPAAVAAQELTVRYDVQDSDDVTITTEVVVRETGSRSYRHRLSPGSRTSRARAFDRAGLQELQHRIDGNELVVEWTDRLPEKAERRVVVEEHADRSEYLSGKAGNLEIRHVMPPGKLVVLLPVGYSLVESSAPVQLITEAGRTKVGLINTSTGSMPIRAVAQKTLGLSEDRHLRGTFRAEDERSITYWLEDPATHRMSLALELFVTHPGQSHVYSVLRDDDNITNPVSLDVDRGRELETRTVRGDVANKLGDSPVRFPDDANILVADLGYAVPEGGSARIRMYQTATDPKGYRLLPDGGLQWNRFLARLRTRAVLPFGWLLTSVDQPAAVSRDEQGRVVLDFVQTGGDSPTLTLTARRAAADGPR